MPRAGCPLARRTTPPVAVAGALPLRTGATPAGADCWDLVSWFAERGILVAPGSFYGTAGRRHVRVALTATDERVASAVLRLSEG